MFCGLFKFALRSARNFEVVVFVCVWCQEVLSRRVLLFMTSWEYREEGCEVDDSMDR